MLSTLDNNLSNRQGAFAVTRYFIRPPAPASVNRMMAQLSAESARHRPRAALSDRTVLIADLTPEEAAAAERDGATLYPDIQFAPFTVPNSAELEEAAPNERESRAAVLPGPATSNPAPSKKSMADVLEHIKAPAAWAESRGAGTTIVIVDSGICQGSREIPLERRSPQDIPSKYRRAHWKDLWGHGSMCAAIAAGSTADGGRFDGVAPDATVLSARTNFCSTDIYTIYDELITWKRRRAIDGPLIINNSYGLRSCAPSSYMPENHPYLKIVEKAVEEGIVVVYAAGNNHHTHRCQHDAAQCGPNTIWSVNSHDCVITVGVVDENNSNRDPSTPHANSSRGPGEWAVNFPKPDCVAPTYGEVVWRCGYRHRDWWGTSGASPQVAGLAALMLSKNPNQSPGDIAAIIRATCVDIGAHHHCVGHGLIDCQAAVAAV